MTSRGEAIGVLLPSGPGDRLLFLTDGMLERNAASLDVPALVAAGANHHPRETGQHLMTAVLEADPSAVTEPQPPTEQ